MFYKTFFATKSPRQQETQSTGNKNFFLVELCAFEPLWHKKMSILYSNY